MPITLPKILRTNLELIKQRFLLTRWGQMVARTLYQLGKDGAGDMAASLSYYALLSVFPLLIGVVGLLGYVFPSELVQKELFTFFERNLPTSAGLLQENITSIIALRGTLGILGLLGLFWSGSALFASIGRITNRAWGIGKYRPFFVRKMRDFALGLGTGIIFFVSLGLAVIGAILPQVMLPFNITLVSIIMQIVGFILIYVVFR